MLGLANGIVEEETEDASERSLQEIMEERNEVGEPCWQSSCLAKFSRCLGMPTEGFEGEILFLLKRMKEMKIQKGKLDGRKKRILESSRFEKELRKLEWTVKYLGGGEGVYSPAMRRDRECFWDELGAIKGLWNRSWCVAGDFNVILSPEEHNREGSLNSDMRRFSKVIEDLELKDLPLIGGPFT